MACPQPRIAPRPRAENQEIGTCATRTLIGLHAKVCFFFFVANDFVDHPFKPLRSSKYIRLRDIEMPGQSESLTATQWNCHLNSNHHEVARLLDLYKNKVEV